MKFYAMLPPKPLPGFYYAELYDKDGNPIQEWGDESYWEGYFDGEQMIDLTPPREITEYN